MKIDRKLELAEQAIASISRHDDEDTLLRSAALDRLVRFIGAEAEAMRARVAARIGKQVCDQASG